MKRVRGVRRSYGCETDGDIHPSGLLVRDVASRRPRRSLAAVVTVKFDFRMWSRPRFEPRPELCHTTAQAIGREGMVTVWDDEGHYVGCMGVEIWRRILEKSEPLPPRVRLPRRLRAGWFFVGPLWLSWGPQRLCARWSLRAGRKRS